MSIDHKKFTVSRPAPGDAEQIDKFRDIAKRLSIGLEAAAPDIDGIHIPSALSSAV